MELVKLDSTFQPSTLIEGWDSVIWTERYSSTGDFELVSSDVRKTLELLPLESVISLRESNVPMIVEDHDINKPKNAPSTIKVTGRTYESVLDRRVSVISMPSGAARAVWTISADKASDAAYKAIRMVISDNNVRSDLPAIPTSAIITPEDAIPQVNLPLPADYSTLVTNSYEIKAGDLYSVVMELIQIAHRGIRPVRPTVDSGKTTIDLEIYNGADLRDSVVFDARYDQFDDARYLLSLKGSSNVGYVYGGGTGAPSGGTIVLKTTTTPSGLARRVLLVDEMTDATLNTPAIRTSRGLVELYKNNATAIFDGEVAIQAAAKFNKPVAEGGYGLGDIVRLNGDYGLTRDVRVAEFIRTEDKTGMRSYPAFEVVEE